MKRAILFLELTFLSELTNKKSTFNISLRIPPSEGEHLRKLLESIFYVISLKKLIVFQSKGLNTLYTFLCHSFLSEWKSYFGPNFQPTLNKPM